MLTLRKLTTVLPFLIVGICGAVVVASAEELPDRAIVDGHPLQPRADQLGGGNSPTLRDLSAQDAREIHQLYQQLIRGAAPTTSRSGHSAVITGEHKDNTKN